MNLMGSFMVFLLYVYRFCKFIWFFDVVSCLNGFVLKIDELLIKFEVNLFMVGVFGGLYRGWRRLDILVDVWLMVDEIRFVIWFCIYLFLFRLFFLFFFFVW